MTANLHGDSCNPATGASTSRTATRDACTSDSCDPQGDCSTAPVSGRRRPDLHRRQLQSSHGMPARAARQRRDACTPTAANRHGRLRHRSGLLRDGASCTTDSCDPVTGCQPPRSLATTVRLHQRQLRSRHRCQNAPSPLQRRERLHDRQLRSLHWLQHAPISATTVRSEPATAAIPSPAASTRQSPATTGTYARRRLRSAVGLQRTPTGAPHFCNPTAVHPGRATPPTRQALPVPPSPSRGGGRSSPWRRCGCRVSRIGSPRTWSALLVSPEGKTWVPLGRRRPRSHERCESDVPTTTACEPVGSAGDSHPACTAPRTSAWERLPGPGAAHSGQLS